MDTLRRQQINEILTYDRNMNLRALALKRKQVARMGPEDGETGVVSNQDAIDMANDVVNSFSTLLEKRRADTHTIIQWHYSGSDRLYRDAVSNLRGISEVVDTYNQLVSTYMSNNITQTKGVILSSIRRILGFVSEIRRGLFNTIRRHTEVDASVRAWATYIKNCLFDLVVAVVA